MPTRNYVFAANETKHLGSGNRLRLLSTTDPVTVRFFKNGTEISSETAEDVEAGLQGEPPREVGGGSAFDNATVTSATAQTVKIFTTRGNSRYDRSVGDVLAAPKLTQRADTPYGYDALTASGFAFAGAISSAAVAGQFSSVQIKNPAASGRVLFIDSLTVSAAAAGLMYLVRYDASLTAGVNLQSCNIGAAAALAELRTGASAAGLRAGLINIQKWRLLANTSFQFVLKQPLRLEAGEAVILEFDVVNTVIDVSTEAREYA